MNNNENDSTNEISKKMPAPGLPSTLWILDRIDPVAAWQLLVAAVCLYLILLIARPRSQAERKWKLVAIFMQALCVLVGVIAILSLVPIVTGSATLRPISQPSPQQSRHGLVFVHGWRGAGQSWEQYPLLLEQDGRFRAVTMYEFVYPTFLNKPHLNPSDLAEILSSEIAKIAGAHERIIIIAHSAGGVIARKAAIKSLGVGNNKIHGIVSIASPLGGTSASNLARILGVSEGFAEQFSPRSEFLARVDAQWIAYRSSAVDGLHLHHYCIAADRDELVHQISAHHLCDHAETLKGATHMDVIRPTSIADERYRRPIDLVLSLMERKS